MKKLAFLVMAIIIASSCDKDRNVPQPTKQKFEVTFSPNLYGQVVPWIKGRDASKGFDDFEHKFNNHVIRLKTAGGTFVIDIPITMTSTGSYTHALSEGDYTEEVVAVAEETMTGKGTYTIFDQNTPATFSRASIKTSSPVAFSVGGSATSVTLNCITLYGCLEFNLGETYIEASVPIPTFVKSSNSAFNTVHAGAGDEDATYQEILDLIATGDFSAHLASDPPAVWSETDNFWYDNASDIYYLYYRAPLPTYIAFDPLGETGADYPVFWCKNYYPSATWVANTTLRVTYLQGMFEVTQGDWFTTIIE